METTIINILSGLRPEFDFSEDVDFMDEGMLDSFDIVNLVTALDNEYGISIDGMDILPGNISPFLHKLLFWYLGTSTHNQISCKKCTGNPAGLRWHLIQIRNNSCLWESGQERFPQHRQAKHPLYNLSSLR